MKTYFRIGALASAAYTVSAIAASAHSHGGGSRYDYYCRVYGWYCDQGNGASQVPEIDASSGLLALAAVFATLVLAWEIRRRKSAA